MPSRFSKAKNDGYEDDEAYVKEDWNANQTGCNHQSWAKAIFAENLCCTGGYYFSSASFFDYPAEHGAKTD